MDAPQTIIITSTTDIINSAISTITCEICNKRHILTDNQTISNKIK